MNGLNGSHWIETCTRKLSTWSLDSSFKRWAPHWSELGFQQYHYSQQTKQVLSACPYRLDGVQLKTGDSMKDDQQEKKSAYSIFTILRERLTHL